MILKKITIQNETQTSRIQGTGNYPFNLESIRAIKSVTFTNPVTFIVGENGSGKSTLLEALAVTTKLPSVGESESNHDESLNAAHILSEKMKLSWSINTHKGFFLRAEDFFGFQKRIKNLQNELIEQKEEFSNKFSGYGKMLAVGATEGQLQNLNRRYGDNPDAMSHGEGFLNLFQKRIVPNGLYILDEPEVALSPKRQLSFMKIIHDAVKKGSQFIIATHSPILMSYPEAIILELDERGLNETSYEELEHVTFTKNFLNKPERFFKSLFEDKDSKSAVS